MKKPLLHPVTDKKMSLLLHDLPQSLLLTGPVGVGLGTVATYIGQTVGDVMLTILPEKDEKVDIEKGTIGVNSIRKLYGQTRTIQSGKLIIVIDYAERMTTTAQNAFLKLLEEPGSEIYFILATHSPSKLLPTITSRAQTFDIQPVTSSQSETFLDDAGANPAKKRTQIVYMADGLPAEMTRLLDSDSYFDERVAIVRDARDLLQAKTYQKMVIANKYKDNREAALMLLTTTSNILRKSISEKPHVHSIEQIESLLFAYQQIQANGNIRLCLARLVV